MKGEGAALRAIKARATAARMRLKEPPCSHVHCVAFKSASETIPKFQLRNIKYTANPKTSLASIFVVQAQQARAWFIVLI